MNTLMDTSALKNIISQISNMPVILPSIQVDFSYEEFDEEICFDYKHPPQVFVKAPFEVTFTSIEKLNVCKTANQKPYITGVALAQKPIIINVFESTLDSIIEVDEVLIDYAISRNMSSLIITKDGNGFFVQWLYNAYKESFLVKNKPKYVEAAKLISAKRRKIHLANTATMSLALSIKEKQKSLYSSSGLVYFCFNCDLLSGTRICENCGDKQVTHFRQEKNLSQLLRKIPDGVNRNIFTHN